MGQPTLGSITLEGVENITSELSANIIPLPIPGKGPDETEVFDMLGVVKIISVIGKIGNATIAASKTDVVNMEALVTGLQSTINFNSEQTGVVSVMIASVRTIWEIPGFSFNYEIKLIHGKNS